MEKYDVKCPKCGTLNKDLYLYETEGRFICEHCKAETQVKRFLRPVTLPVLTGKQLAAQFKR